MFGNRASPDMSQKVLAVHADSVEKVLPLAADAVRKKTYMDDTIKSIEEENTACEIARQLIDLI